MFRKWINLVENMHPPVLRMYHGTNSYSAKLIAKDGIVPEPEDRNYDLEDAYLASLSGAYLTTSLLLAIGYAYKSAKNFSAEPAIVVANVILKDAVPDEDIIKFAISSSLKTSENVDQFIKNFHHDLTRNNDVPKDVDDIILLRNLYKEFSDSEGTDHTEKFRQALDRVAKAYASIVYTTHPVYLGGAHNVRLPNGLPRSSIVSITEFFIDNDYEVKGVKSIVGSPLDQNLLQLEVDSLVEQGIM